MTGVSQDESEAIQKPLRPVVHLSSSLLAVMQSRATTGNELVPPTMPYDAFGSWRFLRSWPCQALVRSLRITSISRRSGGYVGAWPEEQDDGQTQQNHGHGEQMHRMGSARELCFESGLLGDAPQIGQRVVRQRQALTPVSRRCSLPSRRGRTLRRSPWQRHRLDLVR